MQYQTEHYQSESWGYYGAAGSVHMTDPLERVARLASKSAVVIFSLSSCCMCHAVKRLFCGMGVNPTVYELDQDPRGKEIEMALMRLLGNSSAVPVVFIGGKLIGAMDRVMASHINGSLVPLLKEAGALWLWSIALLIYMSKEKKECSIKIVRLLMYLHDVSSWNTLMELC